MKGSRFALLAVCALVVLSGCGGPTPPTPPVEQLQLACPPDITVHGVTGPSQTVSFPSPAPSGGVPPITISCNPASDSQFRLGTVAVTCGATDSGARSATCTFNVTLAGFVLNATRFVAFGDSVTLGENGRVSAGFRIIDTPNAYPTKLQSLLEAYYPGQGMTVINEGIGGERIEDGELRLPAVLARDRPDVLLLLDGYNNLTGPCPLVPGPTSACSTAIETVVGKLRECTRIARDARYNVKYVFVATLTPPGPHLDPLPDRRIDPSAIVRVNAKIKQFLPGEGAIVVDANAAFLGHEAEYVAADGLHLEPAGNDALAGSFFDAIRNVIPQTPAIGAAGSLLGSASHR